MIVKKKHIFFCFVLWVTALCFSACSVALPVKGVQNYRQCSYDAAYDMFMHKASKAKNKDKAVYHFAALSAAFHAQRYEDVVRIGSLLIDYSWSNNVGKNKGTASLLSSEALRYYKGEPFEKAMVSVYTGIALYYLGEYDNARASFAKANLAIKNKYKKTGESDFGLSLFLLALMYAQQDEIDNAKILLNNARKRYDNNPYLLNAKQLSENNFVIIVEQGSVPRKTRTGPGDSLIAWTNYRNHKYALPSILINNSVNYDLSEIGDLDYQAKSKENSGKKTIQAIKGTLREAAAVTAVAASNSDTNSKESSGVALVAGLFALGMQSQADTRQWELLPKKFYVASLKLEPGIYTVQTSFGEQFEVNIDKKKPAKILFIDEKTCKP